MTPTRKRNPWTREEDELVLKLRAGDVAARTGRTLQVVNSRRRQLRLAGKTLKK